MTRNQDISWLRIGAESVAIVGSILLAFAIDAYWDNYQDRREESEILFGLLDEFERHRDSIDSALQRVADIVESTDILLDRQGTTLEGPEEIELVERAIFRASFVSPDTQLRGGVRDALFASGRLELISNVELRQHLVDWTVSVDQTESQRTFVAELVMQSIMPHLSSLDVSLDDFLTPPNRLVDIPDRRKSAQQLRDSYASVLADQRYLNLLAVRRWWSAGTLRALEDAAARVSRIVRLIENDLRS